MKIRYTKDFLKRLRNVINNDRKLATEITDVIEIFKTDPNYPGLRLHRLKNELIGYWSFSVKEDLRILFYYRGEDAVLTDIGTHDDVYKMN